MRPEGGWGWILCLVLSGGVELEETEAVDFTNSLSMNDLLKLAICLPCIGFTLASLAVLADGAAGAEDVYCPLLAIALFVLGCWCFSRADQHRDLLAQHTGGKPYFDRQGFCFDIRGAVEDGYAVLEIHFQNRFSGPCQAKVMLRPSVRYLFRPQWRPPPVFINCEGGAFGVAHVCVDVPKKFQGKNFSFEIFGATNYPQGRGEQLRFSDAIRVAGNPFFSLSAPPRTRFRLPTDVADTGADSQPMKVTILWRTGDDDGDIKKQVPDFLAGKETGNPYQSPLN